MADLRLPIVTTAMITASTSRAAPAYISLTALTTERGGWICSGSCAGPEVGYGAYIAVSPRLLRATRQPLSAGPVGHGRATTTGISGCLQKARSSRICRFPRLPLSEGHAEQVPRGGR